MTKMEFLHITDRLAQLLMGSRFEGHVYAVGGSVRDFVMGNPIKDIDLVVDIEDGGIDLAHHLLSKGLLAYEPVVYPSYGTCMFRLLEFKDMELEAVHTRSEQYHDRNSRNPETCFADINADAFRRDFTINALYYNIFTGQIEDPTHMGMHDIWQHIIRTTSKPEIVFDDDPLRILRAIRFAARYGWVINGKTFDGIKECAEKGRLSVISRERVNAEIHHMVTSGYPGTAARLINETGLWKDVFGDYFSDYEKQEIICNLGKNKQFCVDMFITNMSIVYGCFSVRVCDDLYSVLHRMKFPNNIAKSVSNIVSNIHRFTSAFDDSYVRHVQDLVGDRSDFLNLLGVIAALELCSFYKLRDIYTRTVSGELDMFGYTLPVDGNDIIKEFDLLPGEPIGNALRKLRAQAYQNPEITKEECLEYIKNEPSIIC